MVRNTVQIKLTKSYKDEAMKLIDDTITKVADKQNYKLNTQERRKIKNLSLDQVNMNVTGKSRIKTIWVFDVESNLPVVVEEEVLKEEVVGTAKGYKDTRSFKMRPNLSWTYNKKNTNEGGITRKEFEEENLKILMEDFETAAFYGAFSYVTEGDVNAE